jgi:enoyl-[acyl-carrier protein] reductase I
MGLLEGKKGLIYGLRNERSAAWGCAQSLAREGATFALTYYGEREEKDVRRLAGTLGEGVVPLVYPCDLTKPEQVTALHEELEKTLGKLDFVLHSVAFAKGLNGRYVDVSYPDFEISLLSSCYTFVTAAKAAEPLLNPGASLVTLTYIGGERVIPNYNTAGVAKAALESSVRYIANDLGPQGIRVNAISAGPMMTLSARGIAGFVDTYKFVGETAPLRRGTDISEVGDTCAFLVSDWARGITGHILYVDSGYHILGLPVRPETGDNSNASEKSSPPS